MPRKEDRHTVEDRLMFMKLIEEGYSIIHICRKYRICKDDLNVLWIKYQKEGIAGLEYKRNIHSTGTFREMVVRDIKDNCLTLFAAAAKYDVSVSQIKNWNRTAREKGYQALYDYKPRGRPPKGMGRPKKKNPEEMTELERLRYENERLRAENALLKKVRALVEEREARLREIGRKPSKN